MGAEQAKVVEKANSVSQVQPVAKSHISQSQHQAKAKTEKPSLKSQFSSGKTDHFIGLITSKTDGGKSLRGVAILIASDILLTSADNIFDPSKAEIANDIRFYPGALGRITGQKYYTVGMKEKTVAVYLPTEFIEQKETNRNAANNFAFVKLSQQVTHLKHVELGVNLQAGCHKVTIDSFRIIEDSVNPRSFDLFQSEKETRVETSEEGLVGISVGFQERGTKRVEHGATTYKGQLGSPITLQNRQCVVAIHTGLSGDGNGYARLITMDLILSLAMWREKYQCGYYNAYDLQKKASINLNEQNLLKPIQSFVLSECPLFRSYQIAKQANERLRGMMRQNKEYFSNRVKDLNQGKEERERKVEMAIRQMKVQLSEKDRQIQQLQERKRKEATLGGEAIDQSKLQGEMKTLSRLKENMERELKGKIRQLKIQLKAQKVNSLPNEAGRDRQLSQEQQYSLQEEFRLQKQRHKTQVEQKENEIRQLKFQIRDLSNQLRMKDGEVKDEMEKKNALIQQLQQQLRLKNVRPPLTRAYEVKPFEWDRQTRNAKKFKIDGLQIRLLKTGSRSYQATSKHPLAPVSSTRFILQNYGDNWWITMGITTQSRKKEKSRGDQKERESVGLQTNPQSKAGSIWVDGVCEFDEEFKLFIEREGEMRMEVNLNQSTVKFVNTRGKASRTVTIPEVFRQKKVYVFVAMNCRNDCVEVQELK